MSYSTAFYAVSLRNVISSFGSNDSQRLASIIKETEQEFASRDEWFSDEIKDGAPTLKQSLEGFFAGKVNSEYAWQNWYACELVVKHLGNRLDSGEEIGFVSDLNFTTPLAEPRFFLPLGEPDDFPQVSYLEAAEIQKTLERTARINIPSALAEQWNAFCSFLQTAQEKNRDLVTFTS